MSYIGPFSPAFPAAAAPGTAVFTPYYAGDTVYVWPAYAQSPESSLIGSEFNSSPSSFGSASMCPVSTTEGGREQPKFGPVRNVKRRVTANRKERRRTENINTAFAELRECIPNVPLDTKLSKIKTLRLATSYIAFLMDILAQDQRPTFKMEPKEIEDEEERRIPRKPSDFAAVISSYENDRKNRGRTGWPQHVWALELKPDNSL